MEEEPNIPQQRSEEELETRLRELETDRWTLINGDAAAREKEIQQLEEELGRRQQPE
jgi:hypothetical protein